VKLVSLLPICICLGICLARVVDLAFCVTLLVGVFICRLRLFLRWRSTSLQSLHLGGNRI
jgi:hypothetical protein